MPGQASHILFADKIADRIGLADGDELFRLVNTERKMYRMGAIAPDMFFFAPDYGQWSVDLLRIITRSYDLLVKPVRSFVRDILDPVEDAIDSFDDVLDALTCNLFSTASSEIDQLQSHLESLAATVLPTLVTDAVNIFDEMVPPIQKGEDVAGMDPPQSASEGWYWFDMIHYRHTGDLIKEMWRRASTDAEKAFVLGWSTHHAADVVGHATVNALVGGPYRSHNQRHHFIENLMDVDVYDRHLNQELIDAHLHLLLPHGRVLDAEPTLTTILDRANEVPPGLRGVFDLLEQSMRTTYEIAPKRVQGGYLDLEQLNAAYLFTLVSLRATTASLIPFPPDPTEEALESIEDAWNDFIDNAENPPQPPKLPPDLCVAFWDPNCTFDSKHLEEWVNYIGDGLTWLEELLKWTAELLADLYNLVACATTAPTKVAIRGIFWMVRAAVYEFESFVREALVMNAIVPPDRAWVRTHPLAIESLTLHGWKVDQAVDSFPDRAAQSNEGFLSFPSGPIEREATLAAPIEQLGALDDMIHDVTPDASLYREYANASSPTVTRQVEADHADTGFDSIESLSRHIMDVLITNSTEDLPNWNMDADRGYGYLAWTYTGIGDPNGEPPLLQGAPIADSWA